MTTSDRWSWCYRLHIQGTLHSTTVVSRAISFTLALISTGIRDDATEASDSQFMDILAWPLSFWALPEACWTLSPVMAPTMESFLPSSLSPALEKESAADPVRRSACDPPLDVALGLGGLDLGLTLGVLLFTGGGEAGWLGGATDGLVAGLDHATNDLLGGADDRVDLEVKLAITRQ